VLAAAGAGASSAQSLISAGAEFQVNTYTPGDQEFQTIGVESNGDFVVVWSSKIQTGGGPYPDIFGQRFASSGARIGAEFQVNTYTMESQGTPSIAADDDGDFVVAWSSLQDGNGSGIFARRFASAGSPLAVEFQVNSYTPGNQYLPSAAIGPAGEFAIAWISDGQDGSDTGVFARRFSAAGAGGGEFQVPTATAGIQRRPQAGIDADSGLTVIWQSSDTGGSGVFGRRFSIIGFPLGDEFLANSYTPNEQVRGDLAMGVSGSFVVTWESEFQDGDGSGVFAQRFESNGARAGGEIHVNVQTAGAQGLPSVSMADDGGFAVAWQGEQGGSGALVFARHFDSLGLPRTHDFQVNASTTGYPVEPALDSDGRGFVVTWLDLGRDGSSRGVFARRLARVASFDVDGNGAVDPLTDGLLALRYEFGFRGATLITGAVGAGCTRCTAPQIEAYMAGMV
jgi:hypothetical protein